MTPPLHLPARPFTAAWRIGTLAMALLLAAPSARAGEGAQYLDTYNELVRMIWSRCDLVGINRSALTLKPPDATVVGLDVYTLHNWTAPLLNCFNQPPSANAGPWNVDEAFALKAFPSLMPAGGASFLLIPAAYTDNQKAVRTQDGVPHEHLPVLWEQFEDIHAQLNQMRYTVKLGAWNPGGTANRRSAQSDPVYSWEEGRAAASSAFHLAPLVTTTECPRFYTASLQLLDWNQLLFTANATAIGSRLNVTGIPAQPHQITFYAYARTFPSPFSSLITSSIWDAYDIPGVAQNAWTAFGTGTADGAGNAASPWFGPEPGANAAITRWCDPPENPQSHGVNQTRTFRGFSADVGAALIEWTDLYDPHLIRPSLQDSDEDGLVFAGCPCTTCAPGADPAWQDARGNPACRFVLGASNGLTNGGLRVQAYVTEWYEGGQPKQMLNLDTHARLRVDPQGQWRFAIVKRPSGCDVLFCLSGSMAGQPIDSNGRYRLQQRGTAYELQFADSERVVHVFAPGGSASGVPGALEVNEVRATFGQQQVSLQRNVRSFSSDTTATWPDLYVIKLRSNNRRIKNVASPQLANAIPRYATPGSDLITSVDWIDAANAPAGTTSIGSGPRRFTTQTPAGDVRDQVRIETAADGADIWRYGPQSEPAQLERERVIPGADSNTQIVRHTVVLNPDQPDAHSNVTDRVWTAVPWGREITEVRVGADTPEPQRTHHTYYTDPADTPNYTRLALIERPDGSWTRYAYDAQGRTIRQVEPFGDTPHTTPDDQCRVTRFLFANDPALAALGFPPNDAAVFNDHRPRLVIETARGHEVARTYHAYLPDGVATRRCTEPGAAYDAASNLASFQQIATNGLFVGRVTREAQPDGTIRLYSYAYDNAKKRLTTTRTEGAAGPDGTVTNGTRTVTVMNAAHRVLSELAQDIASGLTLSDVVYAHDGFGRVTNTVNRRTGATTSDTYGCCGVERSVDADGIVTLHDYTALKQAFATTRNGITTYRLQDSWGNTVRTWQSAGNQDSIGQELSGYDDAGRLVVTTNSSGYGTHLSYGFTPEGGRELTTTGDDGETEIACYFRDGRARSTRGTAVSPACYAYGAAPGETWTIVYRGADTNCAEWVRTTFDMLGREQCVEYPDGFRIETTYDAAGRQVRQSDGFTTQLTAYNELGEPFRQAVDMDGNGAIDLNGADRVTESAQRVKTVNGVEVREVESRVYATAGSAAFTVMGITRAALDGQQSWQIAFGRTNHTRIVRTLANATRVETHTEPDGTCTVQTYSNGLLACETQRDASGAIITERHHTYDAFSRLAALTQPAANGTPRITTYAYDATGQQTNVTETAGSLTRSTAYEFDARGRLIRRVLPDGGAVTQTYGHRGELLQQSGARTYPVSYTYDEQGRMRTLATYRDGLAGQPDITTWNYDPQRGWLSAKRFADGTTVTYASHRNGALQTRRWARGIETHYGYDAAGAVTNRSYSDGTPPVTFTHDRLGRIVSVEDAAGLHQLAYATDGALLSQTFPQAPGSTLQFAYDPAGRRTNAVLQLDAANSFQVAYTFDDAGRIKAVADDHTTATYAYGADGRTVIETTLGATAVVSRHFDGFDRLLDITTMAGTTVVHRSAYDYNTADQRIRQTLADGAYWTYDYDALGQLISGKKRFADGIPVGGAQFEYAYDQIGNRTTARNFRGQGTLTQHYTANALNQYVTRTVPGEVWVSGEAHPDSVAAARVDDAAPAQLANRHGAFFWTAVEVDNQSGPVVSTNVRVQARLTQVTGGITTSLVRVEQRTAMVPQTPETFTYDADGNLTADGLWTYTWDAEYRLVGMESLPAIPPAHRKHLTFTYDHQSRRVSKTVSTPTSTNTSTFLYDGWLLVCEQSAEASGEGGNSAATTATYLWGLDLSNTLQGAGGIGGLIATTHPTATTLPAYDGTGNIMSLITTSGTPVAKYEYGPFGEAVKVEEVGGVRNQWRYSTRKQDPDSHLYLFPARSHSPSTGRFINCDPLSEAGGLNRFALACNDPIRSVDPLGLAGYFFGGTGNSMDPQQVSNIEILYSAWDTPSNGRAWYVPGVFSGYRPNGAKNGIVDTMGMPFEGAWGKSTGDRVQQMLTHLDDEIASGDTEVNVFGFSRGSTAALEFLNRIQERVRGGDPAYKCVAVRFVGLWDIVRHTAAGYRAELPRDMKFEYQPLHFIALDERRAQFFDQEVLDLQGALQIGYRGVHADVGGGYDGSAYDWLSRNDAIYAASLTGLKFNTSILSSYAPVVDWSATQTENDRFFYNGNESRTFPDDMYIHWSVPMFGWHSESQNDFSGNPVMDRQVWLQWAH